jgi:hypothetical protein
MAVGDAALVNPVAPPGNCLRPEGSNIAYGNLHSTQSRQRPPSRVLPTSRNCLCRQKGRRAGRGPRPPGEEIARSQDEPPGRDAARAGHALTEPPANHPRRAEMETLDLLQWPAMVASIVAAWLVGARSQRRRQYGFWCFMASNALWIAWGWNARAWAIVGLQVALAMLNVRGVKKNEHA